MKKVCQICGRDQTKTEILSASIIRPAISEIIKNSYPNWDENGFVCRDDLRKFRNDYLFKIMEDEKGELTSLEKDVIEKLTDYETLSTNIDKEFETQLTFGERLSDKLADFGGSWRFIIIFASILFIWIGINSYVLLSRPFDPYPFILLNLILSCLAALQAPVIMMSQNRQEEKDRERSKRDYMVNLKSELEIRMLHEKIDHLIMHQQQELLNIQQVQIEMMEDIMKQINKRKKP